jgi:hypothetical protein
MYVDPINNLSICKSELGEINAQLYSSMFLCIACLRHVSCVPNNVTVSGLSFVIYPSVFSNDYLLEEVFDNISLTTNDIKHINVQHKPLHNILPTNIFLVKIGIA